MEISSSRRSSLAVLLMLALTGAVYLRPEILRGTSALAGSDYDELHVRRIAFAKEALFGARHTLPAWYPHEVLGMPFAANVQSFPWIPTRLFLLLLDPAIAYAAGIAMAAALAALFTFLFCRRVGLSRTAAVAAGWTFACAGYFSSRVMAGHLPLLEAYPALPLLLWLVDRALAPERIRRHRFDLVVLAFCSTCIAVAGHPQVPAYAFAAAFLYTGWKGRGAGRMLRARVAGAIALGVGMALAVWWPMILLIGRSTRVLHLATPDNDIVMPYGRLLALIIPGMQGWADPVDLADKHPFTGYPNNSYFWDTASYIGILPLLAIAALLIVCIVRRRMPDGRCRFLTFLGVTAFLCSLPLANPLLHLLPGTLLRSPARLLYLSTFCVAVAFGVCVDAVRAAEWPGRALVRNALLAACLTLHFADLWSFARRFIALNPRQDDTPGFQAILDREVGNGRIAAAREDLTFSYADRYDDAGGFDSIFLASFNRGLLALAGQPPDLNQQVIDASTLPVRALEALGVRFVITQETRQDLELAGSTDDANLYRVANPAPRVEFFAGEQTQFVAEQRIPDLFAAGTWNRLLLPPSAQNGSAPVSSPHPAQVIYTRPSSDEILVQAISDQPGFVHILEADDPGWTARVNGASAPVFPANGFAMAIPVAAGKHVVRLVYSTPGRATGVALSLLSLGLLAMLITSARPRSPSDPARA